MSAHAPALLPPPPSEHKAWAHLRYLKRRINNQLRAAGCSSHVYVADLVRMSRQGMGEDYPEELVQQVHAELQATGYKSGLQDAALRWVIDTAEPHLQHQKRCLF